MMMLLLLLLPESRSDEMATRNDERAAAVRAMSGTVQREPRFFMSDLRFECIAMLSRNFIVSCCLKRKVLEILSGCRKNVLVLHADMCSGVLRVKVFSKYQRMNQIFNSI